MSHDQERLARILPDAARASSFSLNDELRADDRSVARNVFGQDNRLRITDTTAFPSRSIAQLSIIARDGGELGGTAAFVGSRTLLTSAHNLFIHSSNPQRHGRVQSVTVMPGRNGASGFPFGFRTSSVFHIPDRWMQQRSIAHDYGLIFVDVDPHLRALRLEARSANVLRGLTGLFIAGYPIDFAVGTQVVSNGKIDDVQGSQLLYTIDTEDGESGAPVGVLSGDDAIILGIHRFGDTSGNQATRISQELLDDIRPRII